MMNICETCGREFVADQTACPNCDTQLTPLREIDSYRDYTRLRDQSNADDRSTQQHSSGSGRFRSLLGLIGLVATGNKFTRISYLFTLLVGCWGVVGIVGGYWLGGLIVIVSSIFLTPQSRRVTGTVAGLLLFIVIFVLGQSSPTTWLF